eukprot:scaffold70496_cov67-Cyclotella_meneghiniana.AAC.4
MVGGGRQEFRCGSAAPPEPPTSLFSVKYVVSAEYKTELSWETRIPNNEDMTPNAHTLPNCTPILRDK